MINDQLSENIIGCAYRVYSALGAGFLESVYKKALVLELRARGLKAVDALAKVHEIQLVNYLKATGTTIGLLINFGTSGIVVKRKYKDRGNVGLSSSSFES